MDIERQKILKMVTKRSWNDIVMDNIETKETRNKGRKIEIKIDRYIENTERHVHVF